MNKLEPIANLIKEVLESKFKIKAKYSFEVKKEWLLNIPNKELYNKFWSDITSVYSCLVDNRWDLEEQINLMNTSEQKKFAKIDIWFEEPYNFICEFDESQHFNQYRQKTLEKSYGNFEYSFDYNDYLNICKNRILKTGTSGFYKLKSKDLMFPEMYDGEKQDNRLRQRAFRDFLKDIVAVKLGYNPTVRINYKVANGKIKDFNEDDLKNIEEYILKNGTLDKIIVK